MNIDVRELEAMISKLITRHNKLSDSAAQLLDALSLAELEQHSVWLENEVERMEEMAFEGATFTPQVLASLARSHNAIARLLEDVK